MSNLVAYFFLHLQYENEHCIHVIEHCISCFIETDMYDTSIYLPICKMRPFKIIPDNLIIFMFNILKRWKSRLEFGMYSYTSIFSSSSMQQPNSFTRFLCCSLAMKITSFLNSSEPWSDVCASLLTAISVPSGKVP
jgi:hypothetical protein